MMVDNFRKGAINMLYKLLGKAYAALQHAEKKPNASEEMNNIMQKISMLSWIIGVVESTPE